jgi:hypothetical protein
MAAPPERSRCARKPADANWLSVRKSNIATCAVEAIAGCHLLSPSGDFDDPTMRLIILTARIGTRI